MTEKELQYELSEYLKKYFFVSREIWDLTNKRRIDICIIHKSNLEDKRNPIGIEVKIDEKKRGKDLANWFKQAQDYSKLTFRGFGKLLVVTYPQISGKYLEEGSEIRKHEIYNERQGAHHNVSTFLGQFNIGELQKYKHWDNHWYIRIVFKGLIIWNSQNDIFDNDKYYAICSQLK
jgi:hypothetical protein